MQKISKLRPSPIAGKWYEGNPKKLAKEVDIYLNNATLPDLNGELIGLIAPHAGYIYSGAVAGHAFATVRSRDFNLIALLSPYHPYHHSAFLTSAHDFYATPLGNIPIARKKLNHIAEELREKLGFGIVPIANDREHSLEIELPFLQRALSSGFSLLPIMIRSTNPKELEILGEILATVLHGENALLVASTDLSHFYTQEEAKILDSEMLRQMEAFSPEGLLQAEEMGRGFACGRGAVAATLYAAKQMGGTQVKTLSYATSGNTSGDYSSVVGYGAAAIYK